MTKTTQATIFRKRQILPARGLNKALQEYGSVDGVVPYKADGTQDTSMTAPLGTKAAPFGNAHFKGFNLYTQLEVQQMVENGVLGSADRFVFWNLDTNNLSAWNGTEIIHLGGNGGGNSMDYLFGNGRDGDITMVANANFDIPKNFHNLIINPGVNISVSQNLTPLIIRCQDTLDISGTLNTTGKGFYVGSSYATPDDWIKSELVPGVSPSATASARQGISCKYEIIEQKIYSFNFSQVLGYGGPGGNAGEGSGMGCTSGGSGHNSVSGDNRRIGGSGGSPIWIFAKNLILRSTAKLLAKGANGTDGEKLVYKGPSGGGGGSIIVLVYQTLTDLGAELSVAGGIGGIGEGTRVGNGGNGGIFYMKL